MQRFFMNFMLVIAAFLIIRTFYLADIIDSLKRYHNIFREYKKNLKIFCDKTISIYPLLNEILEKEKEMSVEQTNQMIFMMEHVMKCSRCMQMKFPEFLVKASLLYKGKSGIEIVKKQFGKSLPKLNDIVKCYHLTENPKWENRFELMIKTLK